jgi:MFS family permease
MSRDLRLLAAAVCLSAVGDWLALVTLALNVHAITGSALAVSALFASTLLPAVALAPLVGALADRVASVRLLAAASAAQALVAVGLAFTEALGPLLALTALLAVGGAVSQPAEFKLVGAVVDDDRLPAANGLMESARSLGYTLGPLAAAVLVAAGGSRVALLIDAASFMVIVAAAAFIRTRPPAVRGPREGRGGGGAAVLWRDPILRPVIAGSTTALLFIAALMTIDVVYAKEVLEVGEEGYGLLVAVWMIGMVLGGPLASRVPGELPASAALLALAVQGGSLVLLGGSTLLVVAVIAHLVGGAGHGLKNALVRTLIQRRVPESLHGRAFAAYAAGRNAAEFGALAAAGLLVGAFGARPVLLVAGVGAVAIASAAIAAVRREPLPPVLPVTP